MITNMNYDFITIGGATRDISFFTDQGVVIKNRLDIFHQDVLAFESGGKIKVDKFYYSYGGGAANAAVCLSKLGLKTACLSAIGDDQNGQEIIRNLKKHKVDTNNLQIVKKQESSSSFILIAPTGERIIFSERGATEKLTLNRSRLALLNKTKHIYIASLSSPQWSLELKTIFAKAQKTKAKIFWNPGLKQYEHGLKKIASFLAQTYVLASNKDEAIELLASSAKYHQADSKFLNNPVNLVKAIYSFGPQIVVITKGSQGVIAYDGHQIYQRAIIRAPKTVDTTGIGDVFNSSFSAALVLFKGDINKALELALLNASAKVRYVGAQNGLITYPRKAVRQALQPGANLLKIIKDNSKNK